MRKIRWSVLASLVVFCSFGAKQRSVFAAIDLTTGNMQDATCLQWGLIPSTSYICGSSSNSYIRMTGGGSSNTLNLSGSRVGVLTTAPLSTVDVNGSMAVGTYAGSTAAPSNGAIISGAVGLGTTTPGTSQLTVAPLTASTTGQIVNTAASPTADIAEFQVNGSTVARVGPQGHFAPHIYTKAQVDALVPDFVGAHIVVNNMTSTVFFPGGYSDCISTGSAVAQWSVVGSTHGVNMNGCGSGQ